MGVWKTHPYTSLAATKKQRKPLLEQPWSVFWPDPCYHFSHATVFNHRVN